ncbi:hypothetical protein AB6A40_004636 [Gnathostoma spinigerum]|uniref:SHSP domain-containing protein n=1 Tax=Gnathostoma spinigerum TaxID=75299 RepID=A0ABD6EMI8_9BILA
MASNNDGRRSNELSDQRNANNGELQRSHDPSLALEYFRRFFTEAMREFGNGGLPMDEIGGTYRGGRSGGQLTDNDEKFEVKVDVSQFRPEELSVCVRQGELVIEGHHNERSDWDGQGQQGQQQQQSRVERHFVRKYTFSDDVKDDEFQSRIDENGVLIVFAPKRPSANAAVRPIPIDRSR